MENIIQLFIKNIFNFFINVDLDEDNIFKNFEYKKEIIHFNFTC